MDASVWKRVEELYYKISTVLAEERVGLLDEACDGNPTCAVRWKPFSRRATEPAISSHPGGLVRHDRSRT
jgi:hypothetical protein